MSSNDATGRLSAVTSLISVAYNVIIIALIAIIANTRFLYQRLKEYLTINHSLVVNIPNNQTIKIVVTFIFWLVVGVLCYAILIVGKSLLATLGDEYQMSHYVHSPSKESLLSESTIRVLSWIIFVLSSLFFLVTLIMATIPSAKVMFGAFSALNALTFLAYVLCCVFFMRCIGVFSYVIKS